MVKNLPANAGDAREVGSIPGWGRSPGGGNGNPFQYSCLENPMDRGACGAWWGLQSMRSHRIRHSWARSGWHWELHFPSHPICSSPRWVPSTSVPACIWPAKAWLNLQIKKQMNLDAESLREDGKRGLWRVDSWVSLGSESQLRCWRQIETIDFLCCYPWGSERNHQSGCLPRVWTGSHRTCVARRPV